jgi:hypothetical protein
MSIDSDTMVLINDLIKSDSYERWDDIDYYHYHIKLIMKNW